MKSKVVVLAGMAYGDEGKGSFTDFFTHLESSNVLVKYSGGSQASHTVILEDGTKHKFSQLSSGMFNENTHTYITENVVVNLENLICEINEFAKSIGDFGVDVIRRVHIHEQCILVTPYHKFINHMNECLGGKKRRGSVGTGVSEARFISDNFNIAIRFGDLITRQTRYRSFQLLYDYSKALYKSVTESVMKNLPDDVKIMVDNEAKYLLNVKNFNVIVRNHCNLAIALSSCKYTSYNTIFSKGNNVVFEGAQGFLIDKDYGLKPNTTLCDTTNFFPKHLLINDDVVYYGVVKAYYSRRGKGVFPTESSYLKKFVENSDEPKSYKTMQMRFGWFDAVLFRYASKMSQIDKTLLSSLDKLSGISELRIANSYIYTGKIDKEFEETFSYHHEAGKVIITDIKKVCEGELGKYLSYCRPYYIYLNGWKENIANITCFNMLPKNCQNYVRTLEKITNIQIEYISVGTTRNNKVKVPSYKHKKDKKI